MLLVLSACTNCSYNTQKNRPQHHVLLLLLSSLLIDSAYEPRSCSCLLDPGWHGVGGFAREDNGRIHGDSLAHARAGIL